MDGLRTLVAKIAESVQCPTIFVIAPEMPSRLALEASTPTQGGGPGREVLTTWVDDLLQVGGGAGSRNWWGGGA